MFYHLIKVTVSNELHNILFSTIKVSTYMFGANYPSKNNLHTLCRANVIE